MSEDRSHVRDRALDTLDAIRDALNGDDIQSAVYHIDVLQGQLVDWKRADAREWLDKALNADLLLFNIDAARTRLAQWAGTLNGGADALFEQYQQRVERRVEEKHLALQARGVVAHCQELWRQAEELELGDNPPHPDRLLDEYYSIAFEVAKSAETEYPQNPTLNALRARAEKILRDKQAARRIYPLMLEQEHYAKALELLFSLTEVQFIPRFRMVSSETSNRVIRFTGMAPKSAVQEEIEKLGRDWTEKHVSALLQTVHNHLTAYRPQAALDALSDRKQIERFAAEPIRDKVREFEAHATEDLRLYQQAERRAQQALRIQDENVFNAWDIYTEARSLYAGVPNLDNVREALLGRMIEDFDRRINRAEEAFNTGLWESIGQIYQTARLDFSDKAPELEERLQYLSEVDLRARTYLEYRNTAMASLEHLRNLVIDDVSAAAEMLARLEEYPAVVLEALPGLTEIRAAIRRRLNLEMLYSRLYRLLHHDNIEDLEQGIHDAKAVGEERFMQLAHDLETHQTYLSALLEYELGQLRQALTLFSEVRDHGGHPDSADAERFIAEIESTLSPPEPAVEQEDEEFLDEFDLDYADKIAPNTYVDEMDSQLYGRDDVEFFDEEGEFDEDYDTEEEGHSDTQEVIVEDLRDEYDSEDSDEIDEV